MSNSYIKYLKYKAKYENLKNSMRNNYQLGGSECKCNKLGGGGEEEHTHINIIYTSDNNTTYYNKINENMYVGIKNLQFKEKTYPHDKKIGSDNVYFVFEKLTNTNEKFWNDFLNDQNKNTIRNGAISDHGIVVISDGINSFKKSLKLYSSCKEYYSIWIAYVTRINPVTNETHISNEDIEMVVSVFANNDSPITTHMGIFRNYKYFMSIMEPHLNLALLLHEFAGMISKVIYPQVQFMLTNPANKMQEIMKKNLEGGVQIWIGSSLERLEYQKDEENLEHDKQLIDTFSDTKNTSIIDNLDNFLTFDYNKKRIEKRATALKDRENRIITFLENHSVEEFKDNMKSSEDVTKLNSDIASIKNDKLDDEIKNIETLSKENIISVIKKYTNEFIYKDVMKDINSNISYNEYKKNNESKQFIPKDLSSIIPVNNNNDTTWYIINSDGQKSSFVVPKWFINERYNNCGHEHLLNHLLTVIISIPALCELWKSTF